MLLNTSSVSIKFESKDERLSFIKQSKVIGIYNDATVCFMEVTGEFWSVLKEIKTHISKHEVRKMGLSTSGLKKVT